MSTKSFYKIVTNTQLADIMRRRLWYGSPNDLRSGFIHLCDTKEKVNKIITTKFNDTNWAVLELTNSIPVTFNYGKDGLKYPHLYIPICSSNILKTYSKNEWYSLM